MLSKSTNPRTSRCSSYSRVGYQPEIRGKLDGDDVSCLPDYGAGRNVLSLRYAKQRQLTIDTSDKQDGMLADGRVVRSEGSVILPFHFNGEEDQPYSVKFQVWRHCIHDVTLGSGFLDATQTFTRFRHRITRRLKGIMERVCFSSSSARLPGYVGGRFVNAMPDTGSDVMLMSEDFAQRHGYSVDTSLPHRVLLNFADGSYGRTTGLVTSVSWSYEFYQEPTWRDFYVLPDLQCDVLFSYDFVDFIEAFQKYGHAVSHGVADSTDWSLCTITRVRNWLRRQKTLPDKGAEAEEELLRWECERRLLIVRYEENKRLVQSLPAEQQEQALIDYKSLWQVVWDQLMRARPRPRDGV